MKPERCCESESVRERGKKKEGDRDMFARIEASMKERKFVCVGVCVCEREREREREQITKDVRE